MLSPETFRHSLEHSCAYAGERVLAAVSGGMDSVVLAELLAQAKIPFAIAHVNFGLRGKESDEDERFCETLAKHYGVAFFVKRCSEHDFSASGENSKQVAARKIRYVFFNDVAAKENFGLIATAHHADDSIETALLNLARGTGPAGLTGIPARNGNVIRPLLHFSREELAAFAKQHSLQWREDSSNAGDAYARNRFRHHLLPWLLHEIPQAHRGFEASFRKLSETEQLLDAALLHWERSCVMPTPKPRTLQLMRRKLEEFPDATLFLRFYLKRFGFTDAQLLSLENLLNGPAGTELHSQEWRLIFDRDNLFLAAKEISFATSLLEINEEIFSGDFPDGKTTTFVDAATITAPLSVRTWQPGDKLIPMGMSGHRKVSDILNDLKLPAQEKEIAPVVLSGTEIVWVPGYRIAEKFKVTEQTKNVLRLTIKTVSTNNAENPAV